MFKSGPWPAPHQMYLTATRAPASIKPVRKRRSDGGPRNGGLAPKHASRCKRMQARTWAHNPKVAGSNPAPAMSIPQALRSEEERELVADPALEALTRPRGRLPALRAGDVGL